MRLTSKIGLGISLLKARLLKKRIPLFVGWQLTSRCNLRCQYCDLWNKRGKELTTLEVISGIDQLHELGTRVIAFTGGELLLRDDVGRILDYAHEMGIATNLHTNGYYLSKVARQLKDVHSVVLSLDGPREVNDAIRGKGSYAKVILAAELAKAEGTKVLLAAVLSSKNISLVDDIIREAEMIGAPVTFQPVIKRNDEWKDVDHLKPNVEDYKKAIHRTIWHKRRGAPVGNSKVSLEAFLGRGLRGPLALGQIYLNISYDGRVYAAPRQVGLDAPNIRDVPVREALSKIRIPSTAMPGSTLEAEMNLLYRLHPQAIMNAALRY